jgi:cysteine desulfurase
MGAPVYLDNHATTRPDPRVVEAMLPYLTSEYGNASSRHHAFGWTAGAAVTRARRAVAAFAGASPEDVIFTSGATEAINLAVKGLAEAHAGRGRHILTTAVEHHAVLGSCRTLASAGFDVTVLPVDATGRVRVEELERALRADTILVSVMAAQNEIGTLQPVEEIGALCAERAIAFHVDAAQAAGRVPVDLHRWRATCLSLSAHKMYGPKGIGALVLDHRARPRPVRQTDGAGQELGLRSGTLNVPAIAGFGAAAEIALVELEVDAARMTRLRDALVAGLQERVPGVQVNGHPTERLPNNASITFRGLSADRLLAEMKDVAASSGAACSSGEPGPSHVLTAIGLDRRDAEATVRFGLGRFTSEAEIATVIGSVTAAAAALSGRAPARVHQEH